MAGRFSGPVIAVLTISSATLTGAVAFLVNVAGWSASSSGAGATVSQGMSRLAEHAPLTGAVFIFCSGLICGWFMVHFCGWRLPRPVDVEREAAKDAEIARLRARLARHED